MKPGKSRKKKSFSWLQSLAAAYVALVLLAWLLLANFADRWWPVSILLFGPRWALALPAIILLPWALIRRHWKSALAVVFAMVVVFWPVMGWHWAGWKARDNVARDFRIVTFNVGNSRPSGEHKVEADELRRLFDISKPDVMVLQECAKNSDELFVVFPDVTTLLAEETCLISRWRITNTDSRPRDDLRSVGGNGVIVGFDIETPLGAMTIMNVHFATQRRGLESVLMGSKRPGADMWSKIAARTMDSVAALAWTRRTPLPLIIVGDFNMPVESAIYRQYWTRYHNAFEQCGFGYGYTKHEKRFAARIDHVLYDRSWTCAAATVDQTIGGDHRPLIVDLRRNAR